MNYLQPYKGKSTRHTCPACKTKHNFTLYINGNTLEPIHRTVGKCNRESKCGYHYTPKQYFIDNPSLTPPLGGGRVGSSSSMFMNLVKPRIMHTPSTSGRAEVGSIPFDYIEQSTSPKSNFVQFLQNHFEMEQIQKVVELYALGATKSKEVIFWQIDMKGEIRTGKIMQYNPATGRRIKHESGAIDWVHNKLKKSGELHEDFNLKQCFFGEHLLKIYPDKLIAIVESEKSAIIASCIMPELIWLAAGNLNGLSIEKCQALINRSVILYPDLGAFEKWTNKAKEIKHFVKCEINLSTILEDIATESKRSQGFDIADYIVEDIMF